MGLQKLLQEHIALIDKYVYGDNSMVLANEGLPKLRMSEERLLSFLVQTFRDKELHALKEIMGYLDLESPEFETTIHTPYYKRNNHD